MSPKYRIVEILNGLPKPVRRRVWAEMVHAAGRDDVTLYRWLRVPGKRIGKRYSDIPGEALVKFSIILNVPIEQLFTDPSCFAECKNVSGANS